MPCVSEKHDAQWLAGEQSVSSGLLPKASEAEALDSVPDAQGHWRSGTEGPFDPQVPKTLRWRKRHGASQGA